MPRTPNSANELTASLLLEIPKAVPGARVWRCSIGGAYPIATIKPLIAAILSGNFSAAKTLAQRARPLIFGGIPGLPDIDGILPDGRRLGLEVKWGDDKQSEEQKVCQRIYEDRQAVYVIAKDLPSALAELRRKAGL